MSPSKILPLQSPDRSVPAPGAGMHVAGSEPGFRDGRRNGVRRGAAHPRRRQRGDRVVGVHRRERHDHADRQEGRAGRSGRREPRRSHRQDGDARADQRARASRLPEGPRPTRARTSRARTSSTISTARSTTASRPCMSQGIETRRRHVPDSRRPGSRQGRRRAPARSPAAASARPRPDRAPPRTPASPTKSRRKPRRGRRSSELAAKKVNAIKIWVDDRGGRAPRLPPALFAGGDRRSAQARAQGQRARLLSPRRRRPGRGRHRQLRAPRARQGDGRRADRVRS